MGKKEEEVQKIEQALISDGDLSGKDAKTIAESLYRAGIRAKAPTNPTTEDEDHE